MRTARLKFGTVTQNALEKSPPVRPFCERAARRGLSDLTKMSHEMRDVQH
jgi:hypothetical protein